MSDPAVAVQRQQVRQQGLIAGLITLPFRLFGVLAGSLVLCIAIECIGMHFFWPEQGWRHAQGMLNYELSQVSEHFTRSVLVQEPGRTAHRLVEQGYDWLFVKSGLLDWIRDASAQAAAANSAGNSSILSGTSTGGTSIPRNGAWRTVRVAMPASGCAARLAAT